VNSALDVVSFLFVLFLAFGWSRICFNAWRHRGAR
jgi:hypothetical protein